VSKASPERCDDAVGLQDLQEEANEIEIIRGRILSERAMIHFDIEDPTTVDAAWCFKQYFGELNSFRQRV